MNPPTKIQFEQNFFTKVVSTQNVQNHTPQNKPNYTGEFRTPRGPKKKTLKSQNRMTVPRLNFPWCKHTIKLTFLYCISQQQDK